MPPKFGKLDGFQLPALEGKKLSYLGVGVAAPPPFTLFQCPRKGHSFLDVLVTSGVTSKVWHGRVVRGISLGHVLV